MGNFIFLQTVSRPLKIIGVFVALLISVLMLDMTTRSYFERIAKEALQDSVVPEKALALYQYSPTGGALIAGTASSSGYVNAGDWRATQGNDSVANRAGNYWSARRSVTNGLDMQLYFDNTKLYNANKLIIMFDDANATATTQYVHQICDWTSTTNVDNAADAQCTGGGWRTLHPRDVTYTNIADTTRGYEIYDGYFSSRNTSPGTTTATPLANFVETGTGRVAIRVYSSSTLPTEFYWDWAQIEVAVDPIYEVSGFATTSASSTMTGFISDLVGPAYTNLNGSDGNKFLVPMRTANTAADFYFSFQNVDTYEGMNTILVEAEVCASDTRLEYGMSLWDFTNSQWTDHASTSVQATLCTTDVEQATSFNDETVPGFVFSDHVSPTGEIRVRYLTVASTSVFNLQFDRIYVMVGSVNADSALCEISWGTGTATDCVNTRTVQEALTATPNTTTWQQTSVIEYPSSYHPFDNDDDAVNNEFSSSANITFPISIPTSTSVTAIHYAVKFRSNTASNTADLQMENFLGMTGLGGRAVGTGWTDTAGTDANTSLTYSWFDTWRTTEHQLQPDSFVDTQNNRMNLRLRTSVSTSVGAVTRDWDFAMMSIRWIDETKHVSHEAQYSPTGGALIAGTASSSGYVNAGDWRATQGNDSTTNGSGNYWSARRDTTDGLDMQLYFDNTRLYNANKLIVMFDDGNATTASQYVHQICDWTSSTNVDNAADAQCTGGGWRTLHPRKVTYVTTGDTTRGYEIYDGYFSSRNTSPGTTTATPLANFVETSTGRVAVRAYSSSTLAYEFRMDWAQIEVAVDPIYEVAGFATTSASSTMTGFISDLVGPVYTGLTASDANKLRVNMVAASTAADFYFSFQNVDTYEGMNTILVEAEVCASDTRLEYGMSLWDFTNSQWTAHASTSVQATACASADVEQATSFNDETVPGFNFSDYVSSTGEIRVRYLTVASTSPYNLQFDRIYVMLGSVNADSSLCEISWGTGTASDCVNTRTVQEALTATPNTTTWQQTSVIEYPSSYHPFDNDDDAVNNEFSSSANITFPISIPTSTSVTAIHYAVKFRSNTASNTADLQMRNYLGMTGLGGRVAGTGWTDTTGTDANSVLTYSWFDTWRVSEHQLQPDSFVDTQNNRMNLRLRTSVSTSVGAVTRDWDFAMMSVRFITIPTTEEVQSLTFSIDDNSIGFGDLSTSEARYATGDGLGSGIETAAHTFTASTNATGGYVISLSGNTLTCIDCGNTTIDAVGDTPAASVQGTEQFGVRVAKVSGTGTTTAPYNSALWAFDSLNFPDQIVSGYGDERVSVFGLYYIANISADTEAGNYSAILNYTITGTY